MLSIVMLVLICVIAICVVGAPFGCTSDEPSLSKIPTVIPEDEEILASETTVEHVCSNYYVSKYDTTNHWNECSICGKKYNVVAHTYTETWTMGESCHPDNKLNHICLCGYSYQTNNTREHNLKPLNTNTEQYNHYQECNVCRMRVVSERCKKEDGSRINCDNLGTCATCNHVYSEIRHAGAFALDGRAPDIKCTFCKKLVGTLSNIEVSYPSANIFEYSFDFSIPSNGYFDDDFNLINDNLNRVGSLNTEYIKKTESGKTSMHITSRLNFSNNSEKKIKMSCQMRKYHSSSNERVSIMGVVFEISPDIASPVINSNIEQTNLATSNGWATQKQITVSGTENFCSSVKLTLKDSEGNTYLNNAATPVTNNAWSYTFVPDIEANETGKQFTITVTDNLGNSANKTFTVQKTDKRAPIMTSAVETAQTWTKTKGFTFTATDEGSGGVSISIGDANNYTIATKTGTTYSRAHTFTEEIYGSKNVTIYAKDALGNATTQNFKIYNIDSTAPTITKQEIVNNEIVITGNDRNATLNKEGSGIAKYRYLGSSEENVIIGETTGKETTTNKIALTEFEKVKYAYIAAIDKAGNISNTEKVVLPTYKIEVNPNGGIWRGVKTKTEIGGRNYKQTEEIENPTRLGYEFTGWKVSLGTIEGTTYTFGLGNATLEAGWNLITPTVENNIEIKANTENITPVTNETNITNVGAGPVSARKTDKQTLY